MSVDKYIDVQLCRPGISDIQLCRPGIQVASLKEVIGSQNYNLLFNKPSINGVTLLGDKDASELDLAYAVKQDTTANWAARTDYVPKSGEIIVYTDYFDGSPGIKIGDGNAYVVDLPFLDEDIRDSMEDHINNTIVHITQEERDRWNDKVSCTLEALPNGENNLIFSNSIE